MDFTKMTIDELMERRSQIAVAAEEEGADLDVLETEVRGINAELETRAKAEAKRSEVRKMVADGIVPTSEIEKDPAMEERNMPKKADEVRSSKEYGQAFLNAWRSGDKTFAECRALLTELVSGGSVPVPTELEDEIRTAWEEHEILDHVSKSYFKGNVKIGFEVSATGASIHVEGTDAPAEEEVVIGAVEISNAMIKKWIRVSDEALRGTTVDTAGYLYKEIAHRIVEAAEEEIITKISEAPAAATKTAVGVPQEEVSEIAVDTILSALAKLAGSAQNLYLIMNRSTYPAFRKLELSGSYALDVFEGLKDRIIYTDKIKSFAAASVGDNFAIIGDLSAIHANFPDGDSVDIIVDPYTESEKDLVKLVGREYVGLGIVKDKHLVVLKKANNG